MRSKPREENNNHMIWIEMSTHDAHGGGEWDFAKCIWSPIYKKNLDHQKWLFWENILRVKPGDMIIHLQGRGHSAAFRGISTAVTEGHATLEKPPILGKWDYADKFYRALLSDYSEIVPILLDDFFRLHEQELLRYLARIQTPRKNRFFVYQSGRLQCLNGAYISECDDDLFNLIFSTATTNEKSSVRETSPTSETSRLIMQRVGQSRFSQAVKENYSYSCCFPDCPVKDPNFLIGAHISRWVDNPEKRGETANGLCFCPNHDKAYELGYFAISDTYEIIPTNIPELRDSTVFKTMISPYCRKKIKTAHITPDLVSLKEHRFRCKIE